MKKIALIISLVILISSVFCVYAGATSLTGVDYNTISAKELYVEVPAEFEFAASGNGDIYFSFIGETGNLYIDMRENKTLTDGLLKANEEEIKKTFIVDFVLEGDESYLDNCVVAFSEFKAELVNGINMYKVVGDYCEKGNEEYKTPFGGYMAATKENVYYFVILDSAESFSLQNEIDAVVSTVGINGTFFDGDKPTVKKDFASFDTFMDVLTTNATMYVKSFETSDDNYISDELPSSEETQAVLSIVFVVVIIVFIVPTVVITIVAIILIVKYSKNKKKLKMLENEQFSGVVYQQSTPNQAYVPQKTEATAVAYGAEVSNAQPVPQPINTQPVPQPVNTTEAEQKTVLNGEIQEDNQ